MARIAYASSLVAPRPVFHTDILSGVPRISVRPADQLVPAPGDPERFGALMHFLCAPLPASTMGDNEDFVVENLRQGRWTFVFDAAGNFIPDSMEPI